MNIGYSYDDDIKQIDKIEFSILGNTEIKKISVLRDSNGIVTQDLYENTEPKKGGLNDLRFGATKSSYCASCKLSYDECPGHFGHIELDDYVLHKGYILIIHKLLSCICIKCSKPLVTKDISQIKELIKTKSPKERLTYFKALSKGITHCQHPNGGCGTQIPKIKQEQKPTGINITVEMEAENNKDDVRADKEINKNLKYILSPTMIYLIFKNISDEDCLLLGFDPEKSRPENMIHKNLPVPPVSIRPSIRGDFSGGSTSEDDLTKFLVSIVKANTRLINQRVNQTEKNILYTDDHAHILRLQVNCYIDNESMSGVCIEQNGRNLKSLASRLKGKEGRVRGNLMGKRGNFTARTVITSEPTIDNNQIRVPVKIAMNTTFPEIVTPSTIDHLQQLVRRGRNEYPGANFVFKAGGKFHTDLRTGIKLELRYGDIVERHLISGDIVLANRQPSLHKQSMMGHRIKVINNPSLMTFGLPLSVTKAYNADFDGDEMNIFVPQSIQTQIELEELAAVEQQIISPTNSKTIIGIVQDGLIGAYNLTSPRVKIDWRAAMNIMSYTSCDNLVELDKNKFYTGQELYSLILPSGISVDRANMKIKNGKIISGRLTNEYLGPGKSSGLIQLIWDGYGPIPTQKFIDNVLKIANNFNLHNGFSVGIGDAELDPSIKNQIKKIINTKELEIEHLITEHENNPSILESDLYEMKIFSELGAIRNESAKLVLNSMDEENGFKVMTQSGSKGNAENICQLNGTLAAQAFEGKLVPKKYNGRTCAYYHQNDDRGPSRGLVKNSFMDGLEFTEHIFHMLAARLGLTESVVKTSESGYAQRKLIKYMEDLTIKNDCTLRSANDMIVQVVYGNSGADTTKQFLYEIKMIEMNNAEIEKKYKFTSEELKSFKDFSEKENDKYYKKLLEMRDNNRVNVTKSIQQYIFLITQFMLPVNIKRIVDSAINMEIKDKGEKLTPSYILKQLDELLLNHMMPIMCMKQKDKRNPHAIKYIDELEHKKVLNLAIHDLISPKRCILDFGLTKIQFDKIIEDISYTFKKNMIEPGEMAGVIGGQSMGEPLTQFTLKSFHTAGIASVSSTSQGMPRIRELLAVSKNPKTPQMTIYLNKDIKTKKEIAHKIAYHIKYTTLGEIRGKVDVYYDNDPKEKGGIMEKDNIKTVFYNHNGTKSGCQSDINGLPWLIRMEINREKMVEKEVTLLDIKSTFCSWWEKRFNDISAGKKEEKKLLSKITQLAILSNSDNDKQPILHIRFNAKDNDKSKDTFNLTTITSFIDIIIDKFKLKGLQSITNISAIPKEREVDFDEKTGEVKNNEQYVIYAAGVDLIGIRYLFGIDIYKTICNDVVSTYNIFGIEIARSILINEIMTAYEKANGEVNYQHICMIADMMTTSGMVTSVDRHGMNKTDTGPLARASFEKTFEQLTNASAFGEVDHMKGVSARIMAGSVIKGGTGFCDVILNTDMIQNSKYNEESEFITDYIDINVDTKKKSTKKHEDIFVPE